MDENVVTALVAAGAAIGGGAMTGVFTLAAAKRQAAAAWEAGRQQAAAAWDSGQLQATAQLDVARRTLTEQTLAKPAGGTAGHRLGRLRRLDEARRRARAARGDFRRRACLRPRL